MKMFIHATILADDFYPKVGHSNLVFGMRWALISRSVRARL